MDYFSESDTEIIDHEHYDIMRAKSLEYKAVIDKINRSLVRTVAQEALGLKLPLDEFFGGDIVVMRMAFIALKEAGYLCRAKHRSIEILLDGTDFSIVFDDIHS